MSDPAQEADYQRVLVRALRSGSESAQQQFCHQYAPIIYQFALVRCIGDVALAEDIMIQTLGEALLNLHLFNPDRGNLTAWLYGIARRQIRDELRHQSRHNAAAAGWQLPLEAALNVAEEGDLAAGVAAQIDYQQQFARIAAALSAQELEVLTLLYINRLNIREIGNLMGRSESAINSILHRARQKARERLAQDEL